MKLPAGGNAVVDVAKIRDYCLNPAHPRGRHKARVFASTLGLTPTDAEFLCNELRRGQVGTVVENLAPGVYEVEFIDDSGQTYAALALRSEQLMPLYHQPGHQAA